MIDKESNLSTSRLIRHHFHFAWWSLLCFLSIGITLESLHAFKVGWYLDEDFEIRRLMWTLGHAHGTLLSLVHATFAVTLYFLPIHTTGRGRMASPCLMGASILLPGGFFLGGIFIYGGDPGIGVWLVPIGAILLFVAVLLTALSLSAHKDSETSRPTESVSGKRARPSRSKGAH